MNGVLHGHSIRYYVHLDNDYSVMSLLSLRLSSDDVCSLFSNRWIGEKITLESTDVPALSAILKFTTAVAYVFLYYRFNKVKLLHQQ